MEKKKKREKVKLSWIHAQRSHPKWCGEEKNKDKKIYEIHTLVVFINCAQWQTIRRLFFLFLLFLLLFTFKNSVCVILWCEIIIFFMHLHRLFRFCWASIFDTSKMKNKYIKRWIKTHEQKDLRENYFILQLLNDLLLDTCTLGKDATNKTILKTQ